MLMHSMIYCPSITLQSSREVPICASEDAINLTTSLHFETSADVGICVCSPLDEPGCKICARKTGRYIGADLRKLSPRTLIEVCGSANISTKRHFLNRTCISYRVYTGMDAYSYSSSEHRNRII